MIRYKKIIKEFADTGLMTSDTPGDNKVLDRVKKYIKTIPARVKNMIVTMSKEELETLMVGLAMLADPSKVANINLWLKAIQEPKIVTAIKELIKANEQI